MFLHVSVFLFICLNVIVPFSHHTEKVICNIVRLVFSHSYIFYTYYGIFYVKVSGYIL